MSDRRLYPSTPLHGQVAHEIGRWIVSGAIPEGAFLPREAQLSAQFGVSRQAVREALKVLTAKGLVASRRRAGTYVKPRSTWNLLDPDVLAWHPPNLAPDFLRDLLELRSIIEPAAAELAATRGSEEHVAEIGARLTAMGKTVGTTDEYFSADAAFHIAIFVASGNELIDRMTTIFGPLLKASFPFQYRSATASSSSEEEVVTVIEESIAMHVEVYDAIVKRAPEEARRAMEALLRTVRGQLVAAAF